MKVHQAIGKSPERMAERNGKIARNCSRGLRIIDSVTDPTVRRKLTLTEIQADDWKPVPALYLEKSL